VRDVYHHDKLVLDEEERKIPKYTTGIGHRNVFHR